MQQTLTPHPSPFHRLFEAIAQLAGAARLTKPPEYARDIVLTDQLEREFAAREFRRRR